MRTNSAKNQKKEKTENREGWLGQGWLWVTWIEGAGSPTNSGALAQLTTTNCLQGTGAQEAGKIILPAPLQELAREYFVTGKSGKNFAGSFQSHMIKA